jgi:hypothetical protein
LLLMLLLLLFYLHKSAGLHFCNESYSLNNAKVCALKLTLPLAICACVFVD